MYIDREDFVAWMERIMDRFDMQDKKIDKVIKGRNCLDGEELRGRKVNCVMQYFSFQLIGRGSASAKGVHQHSRRA